MGLWKKEILETVSESKRTEVLDILSANGIRYYLKTKDNFGGGTFDNRRRFGTFGIDSEYRFLYNLYVSHKDYAKAVAVLQQHSLL